MRPSTLLLTIALLSPLALTSPSSFAQSAIVPTADHEAVLKSADPKLAANKRLVYDFWREIFEAGQVDQVGKYIGDVYIQHNPNIPDGRAPLVAFVTSRGAPKPVEARVKIPLVSLTAEGDLVTLSFIRQFDDPKDATKKYATTWFDIGNFGRGNFVMLSETLHR